MIELILHAIGWTFIGIGIGLMLLSMGITSILLFRSDVYGIKWDETVGVVFLGCLWIVLGAALIYGDSLVGASL